MTTVLDLDVLRGISNVELSGGTAFVAFVCAGLLVFVLRLIRRRREDPKARALVTRLMFVPLAVMIQSAVVCVGALAFIKGNGADILIVVSAVSRLIVAGACVVTALYLLGD